MLEPQEIPTMIRKVLTTRGITRLLGGKASPLENYLLELTNNNSAENTISIQYYDFNLSDPANKDRLFNESPVSITSAHSAIAATGTIVYGQQLKNQEAFHYVPPVHIVVVEEKKHFIKILTH